MNWDVIKIRFWEKTFWRKATRVVAMSDSDKRIMQELIPELTVDLVPNGVDAEYFKPFAKKYRSDKKMLLFVGNFKWLQNREAVKILVKEILPLIQSKLSAVKLWIVGRHPTQEILRFSTPEIKISSDIEDIRTAYKESDVLIAPIYGPGGTRYKILESMAAGLPVITTSTGIEGLGATHEQEALIDDTPAGIAKQTVRLLTNEALYKNLAIQGRKLVVKNYNWKIIADKLDSIYQRAAYEKNS